MYYILEDSAVAGMTDQRVPGVVMVVAALGVGTGVVMVASPSFA